MTGVQWPALWKPRSAHSTWNAAWNVAATSTTRTLVDDFDGSSDHPAACARRPHLDISALPDDFQLGVVFGPSGSGKSSVLQEIVDHYGIVAKTDSFDFPVGMAICSHKGLNGESIDRLRFQIL